MLLKLVAGNLFIDFFDPPAHELHEFETWIEEDERHVTCCTVRLIWTPRKKLKQLRAAKITQANRMFEDDRAGDTGPSLINFPGDGDKRP